MKVIVTGGRDYMDWWTVYNTLDCLQPTCIVQGGASGADYLAFQYAKEHGIPCITVEAQWKVYRKRAGMMRNKQMLEEHMDAGAVVSFPGGTGTNGCTALARHLGFFVIRVA